MKKLFVFQFVLASFSTHAQDDPNKYGVPLESIADVDIGWMKTYQFTTPP